jgi:O-antigen/teichoic acid export membrane protein
MKAVLSVFSADFISKILLGVLGIVLIRYLPADEYATYTFVISLVAFMSQSVSATFNRIYILTSPREGSGDAWTVMALQGLSIICLAVLGLPLLAELGTGYILAVALVIATGLAEFAKTCFQKDLDFARFSYVELARSSSFFVAAIALLWAQDYSLSANQVLLAQFATLMLVALAAIHGRLGSAHRLDAGALFRYANRLATGRHGYLFAYFFVVGIFTQADIFMLKILGDEFMLATYGSAFRYYSLVSLALAAVHAVLLPVIQHAQDTQELRIIFNRHRRMVPVFAVATSLAAGAGFWVIPWIDTGRYPGAATTFAILCISAVISFAFSPHVNLLMRHERFRFLLKLVIVALASHVMLSFALIPLHGAAGAAIALLVASAIITFSIYLDSQKLLLASQQNSGLDTHE